MTCIRKHEPTGLPIYNAPVILNFGAGWDSTALAVELLEKQYPLAALIFADTGSEKPETYEHLLAFGRWMRMHDTAHHVPLVAVRRYGPRRWPNSFDITDVGGLFGERSRKSSTGDGYVTLEGNCLQNETLPSLAFGKHGCSVKWKAEAMDKFWSNCRRLAADPALDLKDLGTYDTEQAATAGGSGDRATVQAWVLGTELNAAAGKPVKFIGYDAGPADTRRLARSSTEDEHWRYRYPLQTWKWDRTDCERVVRRWSKATGNPVPPKSACWFCPASHTHEVRDLKQQHPDLYSRALAMEHLARTGRHGLGSVCGLGRRWSWADIDSRD